MKYIESSKYSCTDYTKDVKNWTYYTTSGNVTLATNTQWNCLQDWLCMPHCIDYCISKISVSCWMCIHQPDHCTHHWIHISSTLPQQGQSHMDSEHFPTRHPSTGTGSLAALELWKKRIHSKGIWKQQYFQQNA